MALIIDEKQVRLTWELKSGTKFHYSPCGWGEWQAIRRMHLNEEALTLDHVGAVETLLTRKVHGWEGVVDGDGEPVVFELKSLLKCSSMIIEELQKLILGPAYAEGELQGNSESSSGT